MMNIAVSTPYFIQCPNIDAQYRILTQKGQEWARHNPELYDFLLEQSYDRQFAVAMLASINSFGSLAPGELTQCLRLKSKIDAEKGRT